MSSVYTLPQCAVDTKHVGANTHGKGKNTNKSSDLKMHTLVTTVLAYVGPTHDPGVPLADRPQLLRQLLHLPGQAWAVEVYRSTKGYRC